PDQGFFLNWKRQNAPNRSRHFFGYAVRLGFSHSLGRSELVREAIRLTHRLANKFALTMSLNPYG
ncbi:hypothetical protein NLO98_26735, partial [Pseudomonas syringae]|nr:hypothetical protein [Pseudomonas syringae]